VSETRFELRRLRWIGLAYLIAPVVGILVVSAPLAVQEILARASGRTILSGGLLFAIFGIPVCAVGELAFATPFIVAFDRYRWRWLNGWTASGIGYLSAALVSLIGELRPLSAA
jgi:hypothetical protein